MKGHILAVFTADERAQIEAYVSPGISAGDAVRLIVLRALRAGPPPARFAPKADGEDAE